MTENTTTDEPGTALIVHPTTGEALDLKGATTTDLAEAILELGDLYARLGVFKDRITSEIAARMDKMNSRTEGVGRYKIVVNAPTTETYPVPTLRAALQKLIDDDQLEAGVLDKVIVTPEPKAPEPRVDQREINKLKRHPNPRVQAAIAKARDVQPAKRTAKITDEETS